MLRSTLAEFRNRELAQYISVGFVRGQLKPDNKLEDSLKDDLGER